MSKESKIYIMQDVCEWGWKPTWKDRLMGNSCWNIYHYLKHLRGYEYYHEHTGGVNFIKKAWHYLRYKQLGNKMNVHVAPFTVGPRFRFFHYGDFIHIGKNAKIGSDFAVNQGVVLDAVKNIVIGNHVTLCPGVKVVKDVVIGNNVVVGTMSVVTHNIPDNAVAAGSPARVLHIKK